MVKLECDKGCKREFILAGFGAEVVKDDIQKHGFACPYCGKEYISYYTNAGIRELQAVQKGLYKNPKGDKRKTRFLTKDLQERIKVGMDRLKEEVEK